VKIDVFIDKLSTFLTLPKKNTMRLYQKKARIIGALLLFVFVSGVLIFQILQGPTLFGDNFLRSAAERSNQLIGSVVLGIFNGIASVLVAVLLHPFFKKISPVVALMYVALTILNFIAIAIDHISVISMLELSKRYVEYGDSDNLLATIWYERHWWTHYLFLLISCFPAVVMYYGFYITKLIPKIISVFGMLAVLLMLTEVFGSIFGRSISMNMLVPIGLVQLILPIWLLIKGFQKTDLLMRTHDTVSN